MDNFLHNIRTGNFKRERYRRPYVNHNNSNNNSKSDWHTRNGNNKRGETHQQNDVISEDSMSMLSEVVDLVKDFFESYMECQKLIAHATERKIRAEERKAMAMQNIACTLETMAGNESVINHSGFAEQDSRLGAGSVVGLTQKLMKTEEFHRRERSGGPIEKTFQYGNNTNINKTDIKKASPDERKKIIETIKRLRDDNMSFKEIAQYFDSNGILTFSGKGRWYASTVANILKSQAEKKRQANIV